MEKEEKPKRKVRGSQRGKDFMEKVVNSFKARGEIKEDAAGERRVHWAWLPTGHLWVICRGRLSRRKEVLLSKYGLD